MIQTLKMAYRDLGRNRRRSFFSALALGIGLALLLLMAAVLAGEMRGAMESSIRLESGHLQVRAKSYDMNKASLAFEDLLENPQAIAAQVASLPPVTVATPRLLASGIVASGDRSLGVRVLGIDPPSPANAPLRDGLLSGEFLRPDDRDGLLLGQTLARKLGLKAGDSVNLLVNTSNGDVDQQAFTIRGIYTTHTPGYDGGTVFLSLSKAQAIARAEGHASLIFVLLKDRALTGAVVAALQGERYQVLTYEQMNQILVQTEQLSGAYMALLYLIVLGITATVIVNTLVMAVFERTREIGILAALGMRGGRIMALFFAESGLLGVGGILIGLLLGGAIVAFATHYGFYVGNLGVTGILIGERIYAYPTVQDFVTLTVITFVVALLAALYPAVLAARMEPVEALRGGKQA
jgi:ABC-type lipoprotein release transport system permease subunit